MSHVPAPLVLRGDMRDLCSQGIFAANQTKQHHSILLVGTSDATIRCEDINYGHDARVFSCSSKLLPSNRSFSRQTNFLKNRMTYIQKFIMIVVNSCFFI